MVKKMVCNRCRMSGTSVWGIGPNGGPAGLGKHLTKMSWQCTNGALAPSTEVVLEERRNFSCLEVPA